MIWTHCIFIINNYILLLYWGNFVLTFYSVRYNKLIQAKHAKEIKYDFGVFSIFYNIIYI